MSWRGTQERSILDKCPSHCNLLLLYRETWAPTVSQLQRLQSFVMRCLRIILSVSVRDKLRNIEIRARAGVMTVESMIRRRRLQCRVGRTTALSTRSLVASLIFLLYHRILLRYVKLLDALLILEQISLSRVHADDTIDPRYWNSSTTSTGSL